MSPQEFLRRHEPEWQRLENNLRGAGEKSDALLLPEHYRQICQHLALARERHYPPALVERLNRLVVQAHYQLYTARQPFTGVISQFLLRDFPALVRCHWRAFWLSALLFYGALIVIAIAIWFHPSLVYSVMSADQVHELEEMYDPARHIVGFPRDNASDFFMFGYYIKHNIGIGFSTFAGGMVAGIGSLVILIFNGVGIGAAASHLTRIGYAETFWPFVCGHSAFELTAVVLCGMAGLLLGHAIIAPGNLPRSEALRLRARVAVRILYGATLFLVIAAMFEAFWSSSEFIPPPVKYAMAAILWTGVTLYFLLVGRSASRANG